MFFDNQEEIIICIDKQINELHVKQKIKFEHYHSFFELAYVFSGSFDTTVGGKKYLLPAGSILIFNTKASHYIEAKEEGSILINILVRKSTFANSMLHMIQKNDLFFSFFLHSLYDIKNEPVTFQFSAEKGSMVEEIVYHIVREYYDKSAYSQSMMSYLFCCLLTELTRQYQEKASQPILKDQKDSLDISRIIAYISENCNSITLVQVAEHFHYSTTYISKSIHRASGKTFTELLNSFKMEKATYYLKNSDFSIEKISLLLGYSERSTFDKTFKKYHGKTPIQYRKSSK
ncbi:AraC family transcriptional regulator [Clostridium facile]|uniref:Helix-turn-helix transcriptional regulator n=1 Tax=Clostridium facile TaxID=2763035 RepID=A0ABR7IQD7_9CLOT|nr:AraC family transcriptional regulator [Clostridium facile]MBC5787062.1 helix-turn-helix transcriptional regulator [Clostridium facile]